MAYTEDEMVNIARGAIEANVDTDDEDCNVYDDAYKAAFAALRAHGVGRNIARFVASRLAQDLVQP